MAPDIWFPNLGIELQRVNRVAFSLFNFSVYWYALLIIAGVLAGYATAVAEAKRSGQKKEDYMDLLLIGLVSAIAGLRLFFVAFNWDIYRHDPIRIITGFREGGLAIFGGIFASILAVYVFARIKKLNVWTILDTCAPSFAIGQVIGRWGNFFNREAFGGYTDGLFAMRLVRSQVRAPINAEHLENSIIHHGIEYIQVQPSFLYESAWNLVLFTLLCLYRPRKAFKGEVFWLYLLGYGAGRFLIEAQRTDQLMMGSLPISQVTAALLFLSAVIVIALQRLLLLRNAR